MAIDDVLLQSRIVDASALLLAHEIQKREGISLAKAIGMTGVSTEEQAAAAIAKATGVEYIPPEQLVISEDTFELLTPEFCRKTLVLPQGYGRRGLRLAMVNPLDYSTIQVVEFRASKSVVALAASESAILAALQVREESFSGDSMYSRIQAVNPTGEVESVSLTEYELATPSEIAKDTKTPPVVRLVNLVLSEAVAANASDIHIEPHETNLQVRYRVDGLLRDVMKIPRQMQDATVSRVKIISGADIGERRKPQDGRTRLRYEGRRIDMRVSTLPTQFGEKIVIRLLDSGRGPRKLDGVDLSEENLQTFQTLMKLPQGMILVTGPTGSGKTSTLYAAVNHIKSPTTNIITVEDPIEIQVPGVNQVQVNSRIGVTFARGLRAILRQDPNVILVGEIRDHETASIACEAAQTGHLLLSTLHTNDAPSTITRLVDLEIEAFLIASSLAAILAQRLVRRLCPSCKTPGEPSADTLEKSGALAIAPNEQVWFQAKGCRECNGSGYKGRLGIHELLVVNDEIREMIATGSPEHLLRKAARRNGMVNLMEDGVGKACAGLTTLDEIVRVVANPKPGAVDAALMTEDPAQLSPEEILGHKPRILVVEDSSTVSTVVKYFLELDGFDVTVAEDGDSGFAIASREAPDLIISDVQMPGLDGIGLVRALRAEPATQQIPILMLTSEKSVESETKGLESGADDYIVKPVEPRRLAARIRTLLSRNRRA